jgi:hypothetical protein
MRYLTRLLVAAILLVSAVASPQLAAQSPILYVDGASLGGLCSDGRSAAQAASLATPWCSLSRAVAAAPSGATVLVRAGTYGELSATGGARSGTVLFRAAPGEAVSVEGLDLESTGFLRFEGFRLRGQVSLSGVHDVGVVGNDISPEGVMVRGSRDVLVEGNFIHDVRRDGGCPSAPSVGNGYAVWLNEMGDVRSVRVTIRGNRIAGVPNDAIQTGSTDDLLIEGNDVSGVDAVSCGDHSDVLQIVEGRRIVVRANRFRDSVHGFMVNGHGSTFRGDLRFENNLIHGISGSFGMNLYNVDGLALVNNTVWDTALGVRLRDTSENPTVMRVSVRNNLLNKYSSECDSTGCVSYQDYNLIASGDRKGPHDITGNPTFVDAAAGNYDLAPGSRGLDAGAPADAPAHDRLGRPRWDDPAAPNVGGASYYDMGAHERYIAPPSGGKEVRRLSTRARIRAYRKRIARVGGLVAYWALDRRVRSGARRSSRRSCARRGVVRSSPNGILPAAGSARFVGRGYLRCGNPRSLALRRGTLEAWIKTPRRRRRQTVLAKPGAIAIELIRGRLAIRDGRGRPKRARRPRMSDGKWHHVVVTFRKGRRRGTRLYVDGRRVATTTARVRAKRRPVYIGARPARRGRSQHFVGFVDEVAVYRSVLRPRAIRRHYLWVR